MPQSPFHVLLKDLPTRQKKAAELLRMLPEGGQNAFDVFVVALRFTGDSYLGYKLLKEDTFARAEEPKAAWVLFPIVQYFCN